ncbi:MAG: multicopper oxidase family protein [Gemmatimonadota bacterium]
MKKTFALLALFGAPALHAQTAAPDLYTIELFGTPELQRFSGLAALRPAASPFTAPVTSAGVHRYDVLLSADSLPEPRSLGDYETFVVWAAPPTLRPLLKLGELAPRAHVRTRIGEVAFNRFTIFVTAERTARVLEPGGPYVLRGTSPSMRLSAAHTPIVPPPPAEHAHKSSAGWTMPAPHPRASDMYMPALHGLTPHATPFLPATDSAAVPLVKPRSLRRLDDGDSLRLEAAIVKRVVRGKTVLMYAFNGEQPGPLIHVRQRATIHVSFINRTALPTAVHWHGIRLDNRFDGVPHVTQHPIAAGDSFSYTITFPDAGIYWYHPHHREDIQQDLGLYGNIIVRDTRADAYGAVHREEVLMLDDLLLGSEGLIPFGDERATHALMGRFGNVMLINGEPAPSYRLDVRKGEVVRFFLTNVANTRTFNLSFAGARMKIVGSDLGRFEQEEWVESIVLAPAERYIVDVAFDSAGTSAILNRVQSIDHTLRIFFPEEDTLGLVAVSQDSATPDLGRAFGSLRKHADVTSDVARYRSHFTRAPDLTLDLTMREQGLPFALIQQLRMDTLFFNPVEWSGTMPMMDWLPTSDQIEWVLRDQATGRENEEITWRFEVGDLVRMRLVNDRHTLHAMAHPIHIHGQRFLVLSANGRPTRNYVWKDTVLVPVGSVIELLLEVSNPGMWMLHCHIAEHLEAGMKTVFGVTN